MSAPLLLAELTALLVLHSVDGRELDINPAEITSLGEARQEGDPKKQLTDRVRCVVYMTDGRYISVNEECHEIRGMIRALFTEHCNCEGKRDDH